MFSIKLFKNAVLFVIVCCLFLHAKLPNPQMQSAAPQNGDAPASIGLLLDNSKSMAGKRSDIVAALQKLIAASNPQDEFFVVNFSDTPYLDQDFTSDRDLIERALEKQAAPQGTAFYDAVGSSSEHLRKSAKYRKRVLVIASDGDDNESHVTSQKLFQELAQPGAPVVYCIDLGNSETTKSANILDKMAKQTRGLVFHLKNTKHLEQVAVQIEQEIRKQEL
jgi:Ca-activated chloride channel homolog